MANQQQFEAEPSAVPGMEERHYSLPEIARMWNLDIKPVRQLFEHEPGVVFLDQSTAGRMSRRKNKIVRVPQTVAARVYARMLKNGGGMR